MTEIEELAAIIGQESCELLSNVKSEEDEKVALKACFSSLMKSPDDQVASSLKQYEQRITSFGNFRFFAELVSLVLFLLIYFLLS